MPSGTTMLTDLPTELLASICEHLCLHCQVTHCVDVSLKRLKCGFEDQIALSRLSKTCKLLRAIAQPILFHCYHSGVRQSETMGSDLTGDSDDEAWEDLPEDSDDGTSDAPDDTPDRFTSVRSRRRELQSMVSFLQAILKSQNLAESVRALSFCSFRGTPSIHEWPLSASELIFFQQVASGAGIDNANNITWNEIEVLQELAIFSAPSLQQLSIERDVEAGMRFIDLQHDLSNLKYAVFSGAIDSDEDNYDLLEWIPLLEHAPNLETLIAIDCDGKLKEGGFKLDMYTCPGGEAQWETRFPKLRKLSLSGADTLEVSQILPFCPLLVDLEYYREAWHRDFLQLAHLEPIRQTLRRFCYSSKYIDNVIIVDGFPWPPSRQELYKNLSLSSLDSGGNIDLVHGYSFAKFEQLEILEIEQGLLYGCDFDFSELDELENPENLFEPMRKADPEIFISKLPQSLRILRIGWVNLWQDMYTDLMALAQTSTELFPHLEIVKAEAYPPPLDEDVKSLQEAFAERAVSFVYGTFPLPREFMMCTGRGMLGHRPGHPQRAIEVGEPYYLEE